MEAFFIFMNTQTPNLDDASEANLHSIDYWQVIRGRYGVILLTTFLIFATAGIITYIMPKKYKSTSVIAIHAPQTIIDPFNTKNLSNTTGAMVSRNYLQTQFEIITSDISLEKVATTLDLTSLWNMPLQDTVETIKAITKTESTLNTDLVEISVTHRDKEEATLIAQCVAETYKQHREEKEQERISNQLAALDEILQVQEDVVHEKRIYLQNLSETTGIDYIYGERQNESGGRLEQVIYQDAAKKLEDFKKEKRTLETQINTLTSHTDDELIAVASGLQIVESRVPALYQQLVESDRALVGFQTSGYGSKHPKMIAAKKTNAQLKEDVLKAVQELRATLRARLELVEASLDEQVLVLSEKKDVVREKTSVGYDVLEAQRAFEQEQALLDNMKFSHASKKIQIKMPKETITFHQNAKPPTKPSFPKVGLNLSLGAVLGLIIGLALAFILEFVDTSVKSLDDVERYLQVPVLAVIPQDISLLHQENGISPDAEAYRILRTNIEFNKRRNPDDNCITVVSGGAGEGKSTTLMNLAYVCAQGGYNTLIVDADLRRPRLHTFFEINNSVGLSNYLTTDLRLEDVVLQTPVENLYFLPSGVTHIDAAGILNSNRMSELISDVKQKFDLILIDSPPILGVSDASVISSEADQTMIVVQHRKLPRALLMRVKQAVENVGGNILGVVLNNVDVKSDNQYQYYTSYYTYYSSTQEASGPAPADTRAVKKQNQVNAPLQQSTTSVNNSNEDSLY